MTQAPSIKEALDSLLAFRHGDTKHLTSEHARILYAALATLQPSGERREAIARIIDPFPFNGLDRVKTSPLPHERDGMKSALKKADRILDLLQGGS